MKYLLSIILNVSVGQNVQSVKIAVGQKCRRSKLRRLKDLKPNDQISQFKISGFHYRSIPENNFYGLSSSKILPETSGFRTEISGFLTETSGFLN
jgi:hypothetical protein